MSFQNRIRINKQVILRRAWTWTGVAMTVLCFMALFVPMTELIPKECPIVCKVLIGCVAFFILFVLLAFASAVRVLFTNKVCVLTKAGHHVYVQYGDVFSPKVVGKEYKGKRKIVIDVNRCFDTIVDDHLVSHRTLHGQLFQRFYDEGKFDEESLNKTIQDSLAGKPYQLLTTAVKPKGNLRRYEAGTVAELKDDDQVSYYLLGLSPYIKINGELVSMESTDIELKEKISDNIAQLNNEGLSKVADYTKDLVDSHNYDPS